MKWLRTLVLFDKGNVSSKRDWARIHKSYVRAIQCVDHPAGTGKLVIRQKYRDEKNQWVRNGVVYLKERFLANMVNIEGWLHEVPPEIVLDDRDPIVLYPGGEHFVVDPVRFGKFDFNTTAPNGLRVAIEWETGNVSSSHRSMNKMAIALNAKTIDAGVLIVPSRKFYDNLTDRIGNFEELRGYFRFWQGLGISVEQGLLAISVVEHDEVSVDSAIPMFPLGSDGRSKRSRK